MKLVRKLLAYAIGLAIGSSFSHATTILTVAADGSGDHRTPQSALAAIPDRNSEPFIVRIKAGTYEGPVIVPASKRFVTFQGEDAVTTIITWGRNAHDPVPEGNDGFNPGACIRGADFHAENITFRNTSGDRGQGLALRVDGDRAVFTNCRMLGWQDTLMVNAGRQYFRDCYIEGRVDFIFGDATAVFDRCTLHSKNGGYVTAASTPPERAFGLVFIGCKLTGDDIPWVDPAAKTPPPSTKMPNTHLGRPWRPHGSVTFLDCEMGAHIKPEGWNNWGKQENEATARFAESGSTGPGAAPDKRVRWAKSLTPNEAARIKPGTVLAGQDGWDPCAK